MSSPANVFLESAHRQVIIDTEPLLRNLQQGLFFRKPVLTGQKLFKLDKIDSVLIKKNSNGCVGVWLGSRTDLRDCLEQSKVKREK